MRRPKPMQRIRIIPIVALLVSAFSCNLNSVAVEIVQHRASSHLVFESVIEPIELTLNAKIRTYMSDFGHCFLVLVLESVIVHVTTHILQKF